MMSGSMHRRVRACARAGVLAGAALGWWSPAARAQEHIPARVEIPFNRYYTYEEIAAHMRAIAAAYPELVELRSLGTSLHGREMLLAIVNAPATGPHTSKPAMWIDGNVHGNEIQAAEAVLYSLWYLTKAYGVNESLTALLDNTSFYFLPVVNPDNREQWFRGPSTPHDYRSNQRPVDDDRDGLFDEDPPDDLDGDGQITTMWQEDPNGRWERDRHDPRIFRRVPPDKKGQWTSLGEEGIDNDADGRINEDGIGGDDMNRNWPSDWKPAHIQYGAGPYPFSAPETAAIGRFILDRPNIAAVQSYHNAGGMILRGPGAAYRESVYTAEDRRVYDEIANEGVKMLPFYRSLIIYKDMYTVYGGFVNWTAEGLGIFSFTNELWTPAKYFQREQTDEWFDERSEELTWLWRDRLAFGQLFSDYKEVEHPRYGKVLIGGPNRWSSRNTPTFLLEEECHRNFAFTMYHADQMPRLRFDRARVDAPAAPGGPWTLTVEVRNDRLIPTRSAIARNARIGRNDLLAVELPPGAAVLAAGRLNAWHDDRMTPVRHEPGRIQLPGGVPGRSGVIHRFLIAAPEGATARLRYESDKARTIETSVELRAEPAGG